MRPDRTLVLRAAATGTAVLLGAAAALPAVRWEPLHLDEATMLSFSRRSLWAIVQDVFVDRGGAPAQFFVEHATLAWPGGVEGLRGPSLVFFLLALPVAAAVARALLGETAGLLLPLLLAAAPLAVELATFARMYALFLLAVLCATWLGIRAARRGREADWAAAGAAAAALVYVHPVAPLYAPLALLTGLAVRRRPWRELRPALVAGAVVALPYAYALAVLGSRYHVGEAGRLRTTAGRSVPEEGLHALTPGGTPGALLCGALALAGLAWLGRGRRPAAVALAAWLVVPVAFFALVPAETRFFGRYLVPALPAFLLCVLAGCFALARAVRAPTALAVALVAFLVVLETGEDVRRLQRLQRLHLPRLAEAVGREDVLFSSTGSPRADRPPELLDDFVALEADVAERVEELPAIDPRFEDDLVAKGRARVEAYLGGRHGSARGVWIFRGRPRRVDAAERKLAGGYETLRVSSEVLLVRTRGPAAPRALVGRGAAVRAAWGLTTPSDRWPRVLASVDRSALSP